MKRIITVIKNKKYLLFLLSLVIVSLFSNIIDNKFSDIIDYFILFIFSLDFFINLFKSNNKMKYLNNHFFDLICLIPFYSGFRLLKFFSIAISIIDLSTNKNIRLKKLINRNIKFFVWFFLIIIVLPLPLLWIEEDIKSYEDLIWWTMQTVTTVGYGDIEITSKFGRIIGIILMILGVSLISMLTSNILKIMDLDGS
ncbi:two pore domain potassium channel family protein [Enterococcus faecium]|uniref:two pore domain potassium channel family protein n=1 Tax=Enterococcus TaxID=1350 RepID=UPI001913CF5C|nr:two pore domain potassium channel family protein [Enterococcus faecium]MBK5028759.1 two pore domain potassium channel family protein [Enterococcus faecium]MBK5039458.1 two pore domain potassium channel family protein [Enterococcus faecium]MBK5044263.1 two pore domain potassium channel family protein [Enterococcus faecium]MBK5069219.1 two pore domain potassium channel family protein [Enterococcus faecium]MBK5132703.1 two pore domain potassium channel family protein [Enterococcus faecium]